MNLKNLEKEADRPSQLLPQLVDDINEQDPDRLFCIHPVSQDRIDEWRHITFKDLFNAINRVSWWIESKLSGKNNGEQHVLAYVGTNDLRYAVFVLACMKTGHVALLVSTRNSLPANQHLLDSTHCSVVVDGSEKKQLRKNLDDLTAHQPESFERWSMAPIWDIFQESPSELYLYSEKLSEIADKPAMIIHSSGTTGFPKPVVLTYGFWATTDNFKRLPLPPGRQFGQLFLQYEGKLRFFNSPLFHIMGMFCLSECIYYRTPFLLYPDRPLTANSLLQIMRSEIPPKWGLLSPYTLQDLFSTETGREALSCFEAVSYGGAPLSQSTGRELSKLVRLQAVLGSSETAYIPSLLCEDPDDWEYLEWNPAFGVRMDDVGNDLWELVIPRPESLEHHGVFYTYPELTEYHTGDLFRPHPSKPGLWHYEGRSDDIIVLSNGEKFNPIDAEKTLESHPLVDGAAVFGKGRLQAVALVEPRWDLLPQDWTPEWLQKSIWPTVDKANAVLPAHGQILAGHFAFTSRDKPFARTAKGSIRRRDIAMAYEAVIDELYSPGQGKKQLESSSQYPRGSSRDAIQEWLQTLVAKVIKMPNTFSVDDDLVALGIDSLQVMQLGRSIQDASKQMHPAGEQISWTNARIYELATVRSLAKAFFSHVGGGGGGDSNTDSGDIPWTRSEQLTRSVWNQAKFFGNGGLTVVLTGSTGELGSYLLHELLKDPSIAEIYCFNRSSNAKSRQINSFKTKQLPASWLSEQARVHFWQTSLSNEYLGLTPQNYKWVRESVDVVIHNAWMVNFNQPLSTFESHITGVRNLLKLTEDSPQSTQFHYISSISTVGGWRATHGHSIQETLHDESVTLHQGYAESKYVTETLCGITAQRCGIPISIHRVGQLGGSSSLTGAMWNPRDWLPSLIKSSLSLGQLPNSLGPINVDWVPIDTAAQAITQIVQSQSQARNPELEVFHIVNPQTTKWERLAATVARACGAEVLPLKEWVANLQKISQQASSEKSHDDLQNIPALQLLDFFSGLVSHQGQGGQVHPHVEVSNAQIHSAAMRKMNAVNEKLMDIWLQQWKKGWLSDLQI
ncbi:NRPS-like enzyme [Penicillium antarcticum]|uniref:NRPS-like enzyme n=1 Tax=Penicillium antarcticum TaxID=416450 RepID=UPI0023A6873A|nr:NRPS-like enzyme [Penicillium antarcticum]KAJ5317676.1 NRPS-like enzyme [Penicillium antarcticum]